MKIVVSGSKSITDYNIVKEILDKHQNIVTTIISGGAKGVDTLAEQYADENRIPKVIMRANWKRWGKAMGGRIRNAEMAKLAYLDRGGVIAIWDGTSGGTRDMIERAKAYKLTYLVYLVKNGKYWQHEWSFNGVSFAIDRESD